MKKTVLLLLALMLMLVATACNPPAQIDTPSGSKPQQPLKETQQISEDIQMTVTEQTVAGDAASVTLNITNASDKDYTYGAMSSIETESNGTWEDVKPIEDLMWIEIAYMIAAGESNEETVTLKDHYGTLAPGNYRIVKTFTDAEGTGLTAYGTFAVK